MQVIIPILGILINALVQVASFRCIRRSGLLKSVYFGFAAGIVVLFIYESVGFFCYAFLLTDYASIFLANLIIYFALSYCYFHFINLGETARRVRILRELHDSKDGLSMEEILERYNAGEIVEKRVNRLINNGQIMLKNGRYVIKYPMMAFMARAVSIMKLIAIGKKED